VEVVAREDKGLLGKDWNKSPPTRFTTSPANPTVRPPGVAGRHYRGHSQQTAPSTKQQEVVVIANYL
jgi:hypothetical protein